MAEISVFELVGGQPFFDALVERFYERVERDPVAPSDLSRGPRTREARPRAVPRAVLGRPARRTARRRAIPACACVTRRSPSASRATRRWLAAMLAALDEADAPEAAKTAMREYFEMAATAMINSGASNGAREQAAAEGEDGAAPGRVRDAGPGRAARSAPAGSRPTARCRAEIPRPPYAPDAPALAARRPARRVRRSHARRRRRGARGAARAVRDAVRVGITTDELDRICHEACIAHGGYPSPLHYKGFPKSLCTSVNEVICHGIPDDRVLARRRHRQLRRHDLPARRARRHATRRSSSATSTTSAATSCSVTKESLWKGIDAVRAGGTHQRHRPRDPDARGGRTASASCARSSATASARSSTPRRRCRTTTTRTPTLRSIAGMTFTIEPMITEGSWELGRIWSDGWTAPTRDGSRSAQFEHTPARHRRRASRC